MEMCTDIERSFNSSRIYVCVLGSQDFVRCPESRSVRFSEAAYICMKTMVISIRNTAGVRCREVVRFSEGPLWEVRLYTSLVLSAMLQGKMYRDGVIDFQTWCMHLLVYHAVTSVHPPSFHSHDF